MLTKQEFEQIKTAIKLIGTNTINTPDIITLLEKYVMPDKDIITTAIKEDIFPVKTPAQLVDSVTIDNRGKNIFKTIPTPGNKEGGLET